MAGMPYLPGSNFMDRDEYVKKSLESHFNTDRYRKKGHFLDETYFETFDLERICIDKVFFVVYDEEYALEDHFFDK